MSSLLTVCESGQVLLLLPPCLPCSCGLNLPLPQESGFCCTFFCGLPTWLGDANAVPWPLSEVMGEVCNRVWSLSVWQSWQGCVWAEKRHLGTDGPSSSLFPRECGNGSPQPGMPSLLTYRSCTIQLTSQEQLRDVPVCWWWRWNPGPLPP